VGEQSTTTAAGSWWRQHWGLVVPRGVEDEGELG
jgi:hypothetical protein